MNEHILGTFLYSVLNILSFPLSHDAVALRQSPADVHLRHEIKISLEGDLERRPCSLSFVNMRVDQPKGLTPCLQTPPLVEGYHRA